MDFLLQIHDLFGDLLRTDPNIITAWVFGLCFILVVLSLVSPRHAKFLPSLMISIGICGTFWGTFNALFEFQTGTQGGEVDHKAMVESIPKVLGGMKAAFLTSLIGLGAALLTKVYFLFLYSHKSHKPTDETMKELLAQIKDGISGDGDRSLYSQMHALRTEHREGMSAIRQSLSGEESESSVVSHLIKMRGENNDNFQQLNKMMSGLSDAISIALVNSMEALKDELRKAITEQLAPELEKTNNFLRERLEEMMKELQEKLVEQFGKSFEEFNEAVKTIKKWQEDHREQVEHLTEAFDLTAQGIERIRNNCEDIPKAMDSLKNIMGELDLRLQAFADMKQQAEQSFPVIKENLDRIGEDMRQSSEGFSGLREVITQTFTESNDLAQQQSESVKKAVEICLEEMKESVTEIFADSNALAQQQVQNVTASVDTCLKEMRESVTKSFAESNALAQQQVQIVTASVEDCLTETQTALTQMGEDHTREINNQMSAIAQAWGENMVSIAEKCAETIRRVD